MDQPDPDELVFFLLAMAVSSVWTIAYFRRVFSAPKIRAAVGRRLVLAAVPPACAAGVLIVLQTWADPQVRGHPYYVLLFLLGEGLWLAVTQFGLGVLGVDFAGDVLERVNPAAQTMFVGASVAVSLVYAGSNIGPGPTVWTTLVPAAVAALWLAVLWIVLAWPGGALDAIVIDRDVASGLRAAAALIAGGLVLGRAAAGRFVD